MNNDKEVDWLIRDTNHVIRGPYSRAEVLQLFKRGQIKGKVEVCRSNSYWFALEETDELEAFFPEVTDVSNKAIKQEPTATMTSVQGAEVMGVGLDETRVISVPKQEQQEEVFEEVDMDVPPTPIVSAPAPVATKEKVQPPKAPVKAASGGLDKRKIFLAAGALLLAGAGAFFLLQHNSVSQTTRVTHAEPAAPSLEATLGQEKLVLRGFLIRDQEELRKAIAIYEKNNAESGALAIMQGAFRKLFLFDVEGAIGLLETAKTKVAPEPAILVENLLGVFIAERDFSRSSENLMRALKGTVSPISAYNLAIVELRAGNLDRAEAALKTFAKDLKPDSEYYSDFAVAFSWLVDKKARIGDAIINKAIEMDKIDPRLYLMRGIAALRKNQTSGGEDDFREFVELLPGVDPGAVTDIRKISDEALYEYALAKMQELHGLTTSKNASLSPIVVASIGLLTAIQNRNDEATKILNNALKTSPGNPTLLKALAYVRWRMGEFQDVRDLLQNLPPNSRSDFSAEYLLARVDSQLGDSKKAESALANLVKRYSYRADVWSSFGDALLHNGKKDQAKKAFLAALKIDPLDVVAIRGLDQLQEYSYLDDSFYKKLYPFF